MALPLAASDSPAIGRVMTPLEIREAFGADYLESLTRRSSQPRSTSEGLAKRQDSASCALSAGSPQYNDAVRAIAQLADLPAGTGCGVNNGCVVMQTSGGANIGMCGPYSYSEPCSSLVKYFNNIAAQCHVGSQTEGAQLLNEEADFDVWIIG
ncbi:hypothetical protein MMC13_000310 [Lambiella insularis]|nr:hypothetical protein [Lambiella insularis]